MRTFVRDEAGYLAWVAANPGGFVINTNRSHSAADTRLHRASCRFISGEIYGNHTTNEFYKLCSAEVAELDAWAAREAGGVATRCSHCKP